MIKIRCTYHVLRNVGRKIRVWRDRFGRFTFAPKIKRNKLGQFVG